MDEQSGLGPSQEHEINMQLRRIREKSMDHLEHTMEATIKLFANPEMAEGLAKMYKTQYDAYRMCGFTETQAMDLLLSTRGKM